MTAFFFTLFFTALFMWLFFKFMYPKPPKAFMPQEGDIVSPRDCDFCGYPLAEYRGVLEQKPQSALTPVERDTLNHHLATQQQIEQNDDKPDSSLADSPLTNAQKNKPLNRQQKKAQQQAKDQQQQQAYQQQQAIKKITTWFFCNYEHQAAFHAQQQSAKEDIARQSTRRTSRQQGDA